MKQRLTVGKNKIVEKIHLLNCIVNGKRSLICETSRKKYENKSATADEFHEFFQARKHFIGKKKTLVNL